MTFDEFVLKSDHEQYDMVFTKGEFVDFHLESSKRFALYSVFKFFVEVEYEVESNKIVRKTSFVEGDRIDIYSRLSDDL